MTEILQFLERVVKQKGSEHLIETTYLPANLERRTYLFGTTYIVANYMLSRIYFIIITSEQLLPDQIPNYIISDEGESEGQRVYCLKEK